MKIKLAFVLFAASLSQFVFAAAPQSTSTSTWASGEALYWWARDSKINAPLVTQNDNPAAFGIIGEPGTRIVSGAGSRHDAFSYGSMQGVKLRAGKWLGRDKQLGFEVSGFYLPEVKKSFSSSSLNIGVPIQNIPFFIVEDSDACDANTECVLVNQAPNTASISNTLKVQSMALNSLIKTNLLASTDVHFIMGLRYLGLEEKFTLNDALVNSPPTIVNVRDELTSKNHFYGLQLGGHYALSYKKLLFDMTANLAIGKNQTKLTIRGQTNLDNTQIIQNFGLFSQPTNLGSHSKDRFSVVPELNLKLTYLTKYSIQLYASYHLLYVSDVIRAPQQIDRNINLSQNPLFDNAGALTGTPAPLPNTSTTHLWLQGLGVGFNIRV